FTVRRAHQCRVDASRRSKTARRGRYVPHDLMYGIARVGRISDCLFDAPPARAVHLCLLVWRYGSRTSMGTRDAGTAHRVLELLVRKNAHTDYPKHILGITRVKNENRKFATIV